MTWATFYLVCFVAGFLFSLFSFLGGMRWGLQHVTHGHPGAHGHAVAHGHAGHGSIFSVLNPVTLAAFLAWFGGTGYLLTRYSSLWFAIGLAVATLSGICGAAIVFLFLTKVLMADDACLDPADFEMTGVLGRVSSTIREGGTGEIIYSQAGTRRTCGARAEDGAAIAKGSEIVVTGYDKGIAYVRLWTDLAGEEPSEVNASAAKGSK
jgi:membrane protein implicated in regulation of membrane protease activity